MKKSCVKKKAIDFSDMINHAVKATEEEVDIHPYRYIIIDEYQDVSKGAIS